jgi:hypothetical protein
MPTSILFVTKESKGSAAIAQDIMSGIQKTHKNELINVLATNGKTVRFLHEYSIDTESLCKSLNKIESFVDLVKVEEQIKVTLNAVDQNTKSRFIVFVDSDKFIDNSANDNTNLRVHYICGHMESESIPNTFCVDGFNVETYLTDYCTNNKCLCLDSKFKGYIAYGHLHTPVDVHPDPSLVLDFKSNFAIC